MMLSRGMAVSCVTRAAILSQSAPEIPMTSHAISAAWLTPSSTTIARTCRSSWIALNGSVRPAYPLIGNGASAAGVIVTVDAPARRLPRASGARAGARLQSRTNAQMAVRNENVRVMICYLEVSTPALQLSTSALDECDEVRHFLNGDLRFQSFR